MAQKTQVVLIDDLDGGTAEETISFSLDGVSYEIDLNADNAAKLREAFSQWVGHGRRVGGRRVARKRSTGSHRTCRPGARPWATASPYPRWPADGS